MSVLHFKDTSERFYATVKGEAFFDIYRKCIALTENCAAFLDGPGRQMMNEMSPRDRLACTVAARNLTNDLVRIVSAALVMRSARDGIVPAIKALEDIHQKDLLASTSVIRDDIGVPDEYLSIRFLAEGLRQELSALISGIEGRHPPSSNPVHSALDSINAAFSTFSMH